MSDSLIQHIEKAIEKAAEKSVNRDFFELRDADREVRAFKYGARFLMPIVKKLIEQRDKWTQVAQLDLKIISESENAELLKLLKDKQNE